MQPLNIILLSISLPSSSNILKICYYDSYGFTENVADSAFVTPDGYSTAYSYDSHGNILGLSRGHGDVVRTSSMQYDGNRLSSVQCDSILFAALTYDDNGNVTRDVSCGIRSVTII